MTGYCPRSIIKQIIPALKSMPVVVITGMRQTGKSTFLQYEPELQGARYITFDDLEYLDAAKKNPYYFLLEESRSGRLIVVDEAQRCPEILIAIKKIVDQKRSPGQFLLSGSANFSLLKNVSESLAGRAVYFSMHPFTRRETLGYTGKEPFILSFLKTQEIPKIDVSATISEDEITTGGMPPVVLGEASGRPYWFKGFEQTYLERDIRELSQLGNIMSFRNLLRLAALRTGQLLSMSQLGRDAKLNNATTSRYMSLLEASFVLYRLYPYLNNRASRLIKSPKLYLSDSGLASYLTGGESLRDALFETYVAQNLAGIIDSEMADGKLYFWNVQGRHEVDFIVEQGNRCIAIEVKNISRWNSHDLSGLTAFLQSTPHALAGVLAHNGTETARLGDRLWAIPASFVIS